LPDSLPLLLLLSLSLPLPSLPPLLLAVLRSALSAKSARSSADDRTQPQAAVGFGELHGFPESCSGWCRASTRLPLAGLGTLTLGDPVVVGALRTHGMPARQQLADRRAY
jgi:hypothetical protein